MERPEEMIFGWRRKCTN